ncbi:MAG: dihydrolipoyl dehydrogenase [Planctomycetota bacterium]
MDYDLIVLGGGPGGYVAAERAGARGMSVLLIEKEPHLGGVCLNWGCVPTKTLLHSSKVYYNAVHGASCGVLGGDQLRFDFTAAQARKHQVIDGLRKGVAGLMRKFKVTVVHGYGRLQDGNTIVVDDDKTYTGRNILIATGSRPAKPPIPGHDLPHVVDSTGILALEQPPKRLAVIGGGVIGCEFACFFAAIGTQVTVIEMMDEICPGIDNELSRSLRQQLGKKGVCFHTGARVSGISPAGLRFIQGDTEEGIEADCVLLCTGRVPNIEGLGLEAAGVAVDRRILIDEHCRTNVPTVYACGDVTGKVLLAHAASRQGEVAVAHMAGEPAHMRYAAIPGVIYTAPEVATVGLSQAEAERQGRPVTVAKLPLAASGRFLAENDDPRGFISCVVDAETRALLGVHMIGNLASEIVHAATAMIEAELRVDEITDICFAHPTVGELLKDCLISLH